MIAGSLSDGVPVVEAAQNVGIASTHLGLPERVAEDAKQFIPGELVVSLPETPTGHLSIRASDGINEQATNTDVTVVGPGLSRNQETQQLVQKVVPAIAPPLIVLGDGVEAILSSTLRMRKAPTVLVLDAGDLGRLLIQDGYTAHGVRPIVEHIYRHAYDVVHEAATKSGVTIVLLGAVTVISGPDGRVVLEQSKIEKIETFAGILAALLAPNKSKPFESSCSASYLYRASREIASDVMSGIAKAISEIEKEI